MISILVHAGRSYKRHFRPSEIRPVRSRQLIALSTMANAALSGHRAGWLTDCPVVAGVPDLPAGELEQRFDQVAGGVHAARR